MFKYNVFFIENPVNYCEALANPIKMSLGDMSSRNYYPSFCQAIHHLNAVLLKEGKLG